MHPPDAQGLVRPADSLLGLYECPREVDSPDEIHRVTSPSGDGKAVTWRRPRVLESLQKILFCHRGKLRPQRLLFLPTAGVAQYVEAYRLAFHVVVAGVDESDRAEAQPSERLDRPLRK